MEIEKYNKATSIKKAISDNEERINYLKDKIRGMKGSSNYQLKIQFKLSGIEDSEYMSINSAIVDRFIKVLEDMEQELQYEFKAL